MSAGRARLQRLLRDLDHGLETGEVPLTADARGNAHAGGDQGDGDDDGTSVDESLGDISLDDSMLDGMHGGDMHGGGSRHPATLAASSVVGNKYLEMERRAVQLMHDNRMLQAKHGQYVKCSELEIAEMKEHMRKVVGEMEARQKEVEARAPIMAARLEDYKGRLQDLRISESQYQELKSMPPGGLHMLDEVKISIYETTRELAREAEGLRLSLATARQGVGRVEEEVVRLRAENSRAGAALVERDKDHGARVDGLQARVQRLTAELEQALVRAELNSAKGSMYDELRAKAEKLEADNRQLLVAEASLRRLESEHGEAATMHRAREHTVEMLQMDKAYLSKQVEFMEEGSRKLRGEMETKEQQVQELSRKYGELMERLVEERGARGRQDEAKLQQELGRLQATSHSGVEKIRTEAAEAYEREGRLLREMRDEAVEDAGRLKAEYSALKDVHERSLAAAAEVQRRLESHAMELQSDLRHKAFELGHLRVVLGEKEGLLAQTSMQLDMVQDKIVVLRERCTQLEAESIGGRSGGGGSGAQRGSMLALEASPGGSGSNAIAASPSSQHAEELAGLRAGKAHLEARLAKATRSLADAQAALSLVGQPHAFALEQLGAAKGRCAEAEEQVKSLRAALSAKAAEAADLFSQRDGLKSDLDALLTQRGSLDAMRALVVRALGGGAGSSVGTGAGAPSSSAGLLLTGQGAPASTTIL
ncbi:hypothetical protein FOA52_008637 [Chlamydomonas sp. UWO 241]|nr:hypothetical protein FOA52_008637 [Chlamydomonas sp. UWO 241]